MEQISREGWVALLGISAAVIIVAVVILFGIGCALEYVQEDQMYSDLDDYGGTVYLVDGHTCSVTVADVVDKQVGLLKITHTKNSNFFPFEKLTNVTYIRLEDISAIYIQSH